jgi:hypothetical protein
MSRAQIIMARTAERVSVSQSESTEKKEYKTKKKVKRKKKDDIADRFKGEKPHKGNKARKQQKEF